MNETTDKTYTQATLKIAFWLGVLSGMTIGFFSIIGVGVIATAVL